VRRATYSLVDLAATFVDIADAVPRRQLDGRSMLPTLRRGAPGYARYLIQAATSAGEGQEPWWWRGVRTRRYAYLRYDTGVEELYDLRADPAQLHNLATDPAAAAVRDDYAARLAALESCSGTTCHTG
jgi:N-acetylglucosamine-6-sulfatase